MNFPLKNRTNIMILITQLEYAGAQKVAISIAKYLHSEGFNVILCSFYDKYNIYDELKRVLPFTLINLKAKNPNKSLIINIFSFVRSIINLFLILKKNDIKIIQTHTHYSNIIGPIIGRLAKVPICITTQHSMMGGFPKWFLYLDSVINNSNLVDKMVAVSEETKNFCLNIEGILKDKIETINNGINIDVNKMNIISKELLCKEFGISSSTLIIVTIARLHKDKGHKFLIDAMASILNQRQDVVLFLVGEGEERKEIENRIQQLKIVNNIRLLGWQRDIQKILSIANIFILPSLYESLGIAILEAMMAKVPVIATNVGGIPSLVDNLKTGILIPSGNSKAIEEAFFYIIENPDKVKMMVNNAYNNVVTNYSEEQSLIKYKELIRILMKKKLKI